jgi:hypothetical protein
MYIQLVSYTRKYEEFDKCGVRFAGVSVDLPTNNKTMVEKLLLRFPSSGPERPARQTLRPAERQGRCGGAC